jgi:hypothetical protein
MMSESVLIAQLNASWRVVLVEGPNPFGRRACWLLQKLDDGAWGNNSVVRSADLLRWLVKGAGEIDPAAATVLAELPARCDVRLRTAAEMEAEGAEKRAAAVARAAERRKAARAAVAARLAAERAAAVARAAAEKARVNPAPGTKRAAVATAFMQWRAQKQEARS